MQPHDSHPITWLDVAPSEMRGSVVSVHCIQPGQTFSQKRSGTVCIRTGPRPSLPHNVDNAMVGFSCPDIRKQQEAKPPLGGPPVQGWLSSWKIKFNCRCDKSNKKQAWYRRPIPALPMCVFRKYANKIRLISTLLLGNIARVQRVSSIRKCSCWHHKSSFWS